MTGFSTVSRFSWYVELVEGAARAIVLVAMKAIMAVRVGNIFCFEILDQCGKGVCSNDMTMVQQCDIGDGRPPRSRSDMPGYLSLSRKKEIWPQWSRYREKLAYKEDFFVGLARDTVWPDLDSAVVEKDKNIHCSRITLTTQVYPTLCLEGRSK